MAVEQPLFAVGLYEANGDYNDSTDQFCVVNLTTDNPPRVLVTDTSGEWVLGVLGNLPSSGQAAVVITDGISKCLASSTHAAIQPGSQLYSRDNGTVNSGTTESFYIFGRALDVVAADTSAILTFKFTHEGAGSS